MAKSLKVTFEGFKNTNDFLSKVSNKAKHLKISKYGQEGLSALKSNTPIDTGKTRESWYLIEKHDENKASLEWCNSNTTKQSNSSTNIPIPLLIQYGHATGSGGYVPPNDFINPAIQPVMDKCIEESWKELKNV